MRVLYVNHTSVISGAEQSLLVLLRSLDASVSPAVACPPGPLAQAVAELGVTVHPIRGTHLSARVHPVHTTHAVTDVGRTAVRVRALAARNGFDLIHANTERAGLITSCAQGRTGLRPIVHLRDGLPEGILPRLMRGYVARRSSLFIATSKYLLDRIPPRTSVRVVPNAIEADRFDPRAIDRTDARRRLGLGADEPVLAIVGQISPHKGQLEALEILAHVRHSHPAARLLVVGSAKFAHAATRFDNRGYAATLTSTASRLGIEDAVLWLGERDDVAEVLRAADLLLVPSWYEPFGRVALEGMLMRLPVLATSVGGTNEVLRDGEDGLLLAPRQPRVWADAVDSLLADRRLRTEMGRQGRGHAIEKFDASSQARTIASLYEELLQRPG